MQSRFFQELFESSRTGILTIDETGAVTTANPTACRILNLPETPPDGVPCQVLLRDHPTLSQVLLDSLRMENPPSRIEIDLRIPGASRRVIGGSISHIRRTDGTREGAALFFKDLTRLEQGEEQERLKDRLAALGEMAAGLAHEIRNPLGNIGSTATLLKRKLDGNDSGILALNNIVQEVQRLNRTVTQCLEYARPVTLRLAPVEITRLLDEAILEVKSRWPAGRVRIIRDHDPAVGRLLADPAQIRQVLVNILANAFDAMEGEGRLEIASYLEAEGRAPAPPAGEPPLDDAAWAAVVRVRDDGRGMTPEVRERLFFPFFTTKSGGSGIGLAVVKKILDSHRGRIHVESEPGRGATFTIKLPYPGPPAGGEEVA
jgi:PAS domain S-box-containing protein